MEKLPAISGWQWIKQGFVLFRRQPAEMSTLFVLYIFLVGLISMIPIVGPMLRFALTPVFSLAFMQACADIERGKRVYPKTLFAGFRSPALKPLLMLGILYMLVFTLALLATNVVDDGVFWRALISSDAPDVKTVEASNLILSAMFATIVYFLISLFLWFATPLVAWQNMRVGKAIFFSFFALIRSIKAFFVYILAWLVIGFFLILTLSTFLRILIDNMEIEAFILLPFMILFMAIMQCSSYPSYTQIFGVPQLPEEV